MNEKYVKKGDKIVLEIPYFTDRHNCYDTKCQDKMVTLIGVIEKSQSGSIKDMGFAYSIDMSYAGKGDQFSDIMFAYNGSESDFKKLCKKLKLNYIELDYEAY